MVAPDRADGGSVVTDVLASIRRSPVGAPDRMPGFSDLASLNTWLEARCVERQGEIAHGVLPGSVADVHARERASLVPLGRAFDGFVEHTKRVSPTCLVHFDANRYSVSGLVRQPAGQPAGLSRPACRGGRGPGRVRARPHRRARPRRSPPHQLRLAALPGGDPAQPGARRNGAPFADMPEAFRRLQAQLLQRPGGDREMVDILALVLQHDEQAVLCAVELVARDGSILDGNAGSVLNKNQQRELRFKIKGRNAQSPRVELQRRNPVIPQFNRFGLFQERRDCLPKTRHPSQLIVAITFLLRRRKIEIRCLPGTFR